MKKRAVLSLVSLFLLILDVWLIWQQVYNQNNLFYGFAAAIVTAIMVPIGHDFIKGFTNRLLNIEEIDDLDIEALKKRQKVRSLKQEIKELNDYVESETEKQALLERKTTLEKEVVRIFQEIDLINKKLKQLNLSSVPSLTQEKLERAKEILRAEAQKDVVIFFGKRFMILEQDWFKLIPFGGLVYDLIRLFQLTSRKLSKVQKQDRDKSI